MDFFEMLNNEEVEGIIKPRLKTSESEKVEDVLQEIETEAATDSGLLTE